MSLEPGRLFKVSSKGRKSFDALHSNAALDGGLGFVHLYGVALY
jgi:hypothetical protein